MDEWTYNVALAVPNGDAARILMLPKGEHWKLPRFTPPKIYSQLFWLHRQIHEQMGADMIVLRPLMGQRDEAAQVVQALWLMDNRTADWKPPEGACWVDRAGLNEVVLVVMIFS